MKSRRIKKTKSQKILIIIPIFGLFICLVLVYVKFSLPNFFSTLTKVDFVSPVVPVTKEEQMKTIMEEYGLKVQQLSIGDDIIATCSGGLTFFMPNQKNIKPLVASLQFIISRSKIEGKVPRSIDLRYNKPIVIY